MACSDQIEVGVKFALLNDTRRVSAVHKHIVAKKKSSNLRIILNISNYFKNKPKSHFIFLETWPYVYSLSYIFLIQTKYFISRYENLLIY